MKKTIILRAAALLAMSLILASCAAFGARGATGTVRVALGGGTGAKAGNVNPGFLPIFTSLTVTVSGPDMSPVSATISLDGVTIDATNYQTFERLLSASLEVPAGSGRVVEIYAVPDWDLTELYYSLAEPDNTYSYLSFVKAYGGSSTVNVKASGTTNVSIRLEVAETKILLPDSAENASYIYAADSVFDTAPAQTQVYLDSGRDLEFDRYGYLYASDADGIMKYSNPEDPDGSDTDHSGLPETDSPLAYDKTRDYFYFISGGLASSADGLTISLPAGWSLSDPPALAVDPSGYVYASLNNAEYGPCIARLSVSGTTATVVAAASYESLGLTVGMVEISQLTVSDMQVKDGRLYIAAGEHQPNSSLHHGKIVEARLSDLAWLREIGWADATDSVPISDPSNHFYGPTRFVALAPRKLVFADEGLDAVEGKDINRVVEVDLDTWSVSGVSGIWTYDYGGVPTPLDLTLFENYMPIY